MGNRHNVEVTAGLLYGRGRRGYLVLVERDLLKGTTRSRRHDNSKEMELAVGGVAQ